MTCIRLLLVGLIAAASVAAADDPPPFGTVVQQWQLPHAGAITWCRDSDRFYLCGEGGWSFDPLDPPGTLRQENWVFPNMGAAVLDIPWSFAWDNDSGCFWLANILDGNIYGGCVYTRIRRTAAGDTWRWFSENPGDTWLVGDSSGGGGGSMFWLACSEKWLNRGFFVGVPVARSESTNNHIWKFDPYTKTSLGRLLHGNTASERGVTLVPWDSNYIITTGWNANNMYKRDSTGLPLESVPGVPAYIALWAPQTVRPDDTVFLFGMSAFNDTLQKISVGMLWSQLPGSVAIAEPALLPAQPAAFRIEPNPCRGFATLSFTGPLEHLGTSALSLSLFDISGRLVRHSAHIVYNPSFRLDLRSVPAGVYVLRLNAGTLTTSAKLMLEH